MDNLLLNFYANIDVFFLVMIRLLGFFVVVPIFGGSNAPTIVKISISVFFSMIIVTTQGVGQDLVYTSLLEYAGYIMVEALVGLLLGYIVFFIFSIFYYVGQLIDFQIGFSMVSVYDPISQLQVPITGNLYYLAICALLLAIGGDRTIFKTVLLSYKSLPLGQSNLLSETLLRTIMDISFQFLSIGFQIAMPVVGAIIVLDVVLGLLTKTSPQMHIFSIGINLKIIVGLIVLFFVVPTYLDVADAIFDRILRYMSILIRGMMPSGG